MATVRITLTVAGWLALGHAWASEGAAVSRDGKGAKAAQAISKAKASGNPASKAKLPSAVPAVPGAGRMQVEEPASSAPPLSAARESKAWQKSHARGLTDAQKQAFRDRKEKMEGMIAIIKEKRKAMAAAKPEERAAIARELHTLMLEKDPGAGTARVFLDMQSGILEDKASGKQNAKAGEAAEARRLQSELRQQQKAARKAQSEDD